MMEIDENSFKKLFIISENALYFTFSSMGIPSIVCKGWIINIEGKYSKFARLSVERYLDKTYDYKLKHVSTYRGYSHYVKQDKTKKSNQTKTTPILRMNLRSRSKRKKKKDMENKDGVKKAQQQEEVVGDDNYDDNDKIKDTKSTKNTNRRKRKLLDSEDNDASINDAREPPRKRRRVPRRRKSKITTST